jgi:hypothetical protein
LRAWNTHFAVVRIPRISWLSGPLSSAPTLSINLTLPASGSSAGLDRAFGLAGTVCPYGDNPMDWSSALVHGWPLNPSGPASSERLMG